MQARNGRIHGRPEPSVNVEKWQAGHPWIHRWPRAQPQRRIGSLGVLNISAHPPSTSTRLLYPSHGLVTEPALSPTYGPVALLEHQYSVKTLKKRGKGRKPSPALSTQFPSSDGMISLGKGGLFLGTVYGDRMKSLVESWVGWWRSDSFAVHFCVSVVFYLASRPRPRPAPVRATAESSRHSGAP